MIARDPLSVLLDRARPGDPPAKRCEGAAVRVLARVAVLEAAGHRPDRVRRLVARRCFGLAAVSLVAAGLLLSTGSGDSRPSRDPAPTLSSLVEAALGGDVVARNRVLLAGRPAREALLRRAGTCDGRSAEALRMLRAAGGVRSPEDAARVADLVADPVLRPEALDLLVADVGTAGAERLGALLRSSPEVEAHVVDALLRLGGHGRRGSAVDALLLGAAAGRCVAAAGAVRLGGAPVLDRLLDALPEEDLEDRAVVEAVRTGPATVSARLVRLAESGDERALTLAAAVGAEGVEPILVARALGGRRDAAVRAVALLDRLPGVDRWLGLARALEGPAADVARRVFASAPAEAVTALRHRALDSTADRTAAMTGLAALGPRGLEVVERMSSQPAFLPAALWALETSPCVEASRILADVGSRPGLLYPATEALGRRLAAGHAEAGVVLLAMATAGAEQAAVAALLLGGPAGEERLREASRIPRAARLAGAALDRLAQRSRDGVEAAGARRRGRGAPTT